MYPNRSPDCLHPQTTEMAQDTPQPALTFEAVILLLSQQLSQWRWLQYTFYVLAMLFALPEACRRLKELKLFLLPLFVNCDRIERLLLAIPVPLDPDLTSSPRKPIRAP